MNSRGNTLLVSLLLGILTLLALVPGIWEPTGLSGKDEYFLGLRTPMEMMARQEWLVPFLDGVPRIRKPPLMYWLGRGSYELFGVSLTSARMVTVLFSLLMVLSTVGIARRFLPRADQAWVAGAVLLACLGLHTESRRFMLDIPVAALSTAAFWAWLVWLEKPRWFKLLWVTLLLSAGFMVKGPVVALVFLGGVIATYWLPPLHSGWTQKLPRQILPQLILLVALCAPWFFWVRQAYPDAVAAVVADEVESRQFMTLTPGILFGLLNISLPWFFVFWAGLWRNRQQAGVPRALLVWFAITFVPFLFLKSFDRYLLGSLVPLSIVVAHQLLRPERRVVWAHRSGLVVALLLGLGLAGFSLWFQLDGGLWIVLPALFLIWAWWYPTRRTLWPVLLAPMIYWVALLWGVFPGLGIGAIPDDVVAAAKTESVVFYDGPQPAMLPILSQQPHRHVARLAPQDWAALGTTSIWTDSKGATALLRDADAAGVRLTPPRCYLALAGHGSGMRFARPGAQWEDWQNALRQRSLSGLMTQICSYRQAQP